MGASPGKDVFQRSICSLRMLIVRLPPLVWRQVHEKKSYIQPSAVYAKKTCWESLINALLGLKVSGFDIKYRDDNYAASFSMFCDRCEEKDGSVGL